MSHLVTDLAREGRFTHATTYQRVGYASAALLLTSALVHGVVFLVDGGSWQGPISWRKPIVFGLSFGITVLTLTWLLTFFRLRNVTGWIVVTVLAAASLGEVFLITMQKWRGVESHFNETTRFDESVFSWMGILVMLIALISIFIAVRSFFRLDAPPSLAWAIRLGLVLMLVSQAVGVHMIIEGGNTFGAAGSMKLPHTFTLHAVQVLPALALLLGLSEYVEERRLRVVMLGAAGYSGLIALLGLRTHALGHPFTGPTHPA